MSTFLTDALELPPLPLLAVRTTSMPPEVRALPPPPEVPFVMGDLGAFLDLPPIGGAIEANLPRIAEANNPGSSSPLNQSYRPVTIDQTRSVTACTVPVVNSNGQFQGHDPGAGSKGVLVTSGGGALQNHDGSFQAKSYVIEDHGVSVDQRPGGLPMEVNADAQNLTKSAKIWADYLPVAKHVNADASKAGGVPKNHSIK